MEISLPFIKQEIGSGDIVKAATSAVGVKPCTPCEERKRLMNERLRFVPHWTRPPHVPQGWTQEAAFSKPAGDVRRYRHESGKVIIWNVIDGQYKNSHTFCCGEKMQPMIDAKWDEMCRSL